MKCIPKWRDIKCDNLAQRINDDINLCTQNGLTVLVQVTGACISIVVFTVILFLVLKNSTHGNYWVIAFSYGYVIIGSILTLWVGKPLTKKLFDLQKSNADHRTVLAALNFEGPKEINHYLDHLSDISFKTMCSIKLKRLIGLVTGLLAQIDIIFPMLILAPIYFSGKISFGLLFQITNAMSVLQLSSAYIYQTYPQLADLRATWNRLIFLKEV